MASNKTTGNAPDFHGIYETFHSKIVRYLTHMVGQRDAEDLAQEVFVKVNRTLKTFQRKDNMEDMEDKQQLDITYHYNGNIYRKRNVPRLSVWLLRRCEKIERFLLG